MFRPETQGIWRMIPAKRCTQWIILVVYSSLLFIVNASPLKVCPMPNPQKAEYTGPLIWAAEGTIVSVRCKEKYHVQNPTIKCHNGKWSDPYPPCTLVECELPHQPETGNLVMPCRLFNCTVTYICDEGYVYSGTDTRVCQRNAQWSGVAGECEAFHCPELPEPLRGRVIQPKRTYLAKAKILCDEGYIYSEPNSTVRLCLGNKTWSGAEGVCEEVQCPELEDPAHGTVQVHQRNYKAEALVKCDEGYIYDRPHSVTRQCLGNNIWSGEQGKCREILCPELKAQLNGRVLQPNRTYLANATIVCDEGYIYSEPNSTVRQCLGNNTWSGEEGVCERRECPEILPVENGILSVKNGKFKDLVTLQCRTGHVLDGPSSIACGKDGRWSSEIGYCTTLDTEKRSSDPLLVGLIVPVLILMVVVIAIFGICIYMYQQRHVIQGRITRPENERLLPQCTSEVHCSFAMNRDFTAEYSDVESPEYHIFESQVRQKIISVMKDDSRIGKYCTGVTILYLCRKTKTGFLSIEFCKDISISYIADAIGKARIKSPNNMDVFYEINCKSILFRDKPLIWMLADIHRKGHVSSDVSNYAKIDFDKEYVSPRLVRNVKLDDMILGPLEEHHYKHHHNRDDLIKEQDIIRPHNYGNYTCICGHAERGKSTMVQHLLWSWANGAMNLSVIFLLNIGNNNIMKNERTISLPHLLSLFGVYKTDNAEVIFDVKWLKRNKTNIGIILDGLDCIVDFKEKWNCDTRLPELQDKAKPLDWCFALMKRTLLPASTLIVVSRPFLDLGIIVGSSTDLKFIQMTGFSKDENPPTKTAATAATTTTTTTAATTTTITVAAGAEAESQTCV